MSEEIFLYSSESVNEGHPDKICDQVSDAVLDAALAQDPHAKVACETCAKTGMIMIFGEISTTANIDFQKVVRGAIQKIGYDDSAKGFDYKTMSLLVAIEQQSPDIAGGVHIDRHPEDVGAGDQGHMFGYATDETEELMPLTHVLATKLGLALTKARKDGTIPWLLPDGKTQVVVEYKKDSKGFITPIRVHTVLLSTQHEDGIPLEQQRSEILEKIIKPTIPDQFYDENTKVLINPSGRFVIGGPQGDAGLTGRKIIIDTYGGWGAHGGGAFSGKDPTKVDRSAAYAARWIAKSLVHAKLAKRCLVQVAYAIGVAEPLSVCVDSYGTSDKTNGELLEIVRKNFDLRPGFILKDLDLLRPIYSKTACYGHFGRNEPEFTWEQPKELQM